MTHRFRLALSSTLVLLLAGALAAPPASADTVSQNAVDWLLDNQQPDGGFELAEFPPFETPDAILAIAENAQTSPTWDESAALTAVQAADVNGDAAGGTPLDWADAYLATQEPLGPGIAAKFVALVAHPLGLNEATFDPAGDGDPVDLVASIDAGLLEDGSYSPSAVNDTLYVVLAHVLLGRAVPEATVAYLRAVQLEDGGWNYNGQTSGDDRPDADVDTTARAVQALVAAGLPAGDRAVASAMKFLADRYRGTGAWQSFGLDDTNSTAMGLLAVVSAGWRPASSCWRLSSSSQTAAGGYVNPAVWLRAQQITNGDEAELGRFRSANDPDPIAPQWPVNSSATTQAVQALLRGWLPVAPADAPRTEGFADVPACTWYTQGVAWMAANGITRSTTGDFGPKSGMTNGQLALLLWNTMDAPSGLPDHTFTDIPANAGYNDAVDWMVATGLVADGGTFGPKREVNRGRIAYLLWKAAGAPEAPDIDVDDVPSGAYYEDAVDWAVEYGILTLQPNGNVLPKNKVTRAQAALMLHRLASTAPAWGEVAVPSTVEF